jgi:anti-anti-sigma factor
MFTDVPEAIVVRLSGQVLNGEALRTIVLTAPMLYLDLGNVCVATAEGLGALVRLNCDVRARGGKTVLLNVTTDVYEVFEVTRLVTVLDVRPLIVPVVEG